jgi:hypothetical protein
MNATLARGLHDAHPMAERAIAGTQQRVLDGDGIKRFARENGLSLVLAGLFLIAFVGQVATGLAAYNAELHEHGRAAVSLGAYLTSGHFLEALFENWESEFLQMAIFVVLTVKLRQRGSSESKGFGDNGVDDDPRRHRVDPDAPWAVHRGGVVLKVYEHSLTIVLGAMFLSAFLLHAVHGLQHVNAQHAMHGQPPETLAGYVASAQFWFESFQNWQSEFFSVLALVLLSIWLRERGSAQSKPVAAPHRKTGTS